MKEKEKKVYESACVRMKVREMEREKESDV